MDIDRGHVDTRLEAARVVLLGMRCAFTEPVLDALLAAPSIDLRAVVLPGAAHAPSADPVGGMVKWNDIPVQGVESRSTLNAPGLRAALEAIAPELVVVACFPWRIPAWLRSLPTHGCLNIHPSLLPDGRGPEPVYWAFRWGLAETGVTLHLVDQGFDTGPIMAQERYAMPDDATTETLEQDLAALGARLLIETLPALLDGTAAASPQGAGLARPAPRPGPGDLVVPTSWSARHAARFIRAVAPGYGPVVVLVQATGQRLAVSAVLAVDDGVTPADPVRMMGSEAHIRFTPGLLTCRLHTSSHPLALRHSGR